MFKNNFSKNCILTAVLIFNATIGSAAIKWDSLEQAGIAKLGDSYLTLPFTFTNTGDKPVSIIDARPSCGCTEAVIDTRVIAPGAKGEITAIFTVGSRKGDQFKTIAVRTSDDPQKPVILKVKVHIEAAAETSTPKLEWEHGEAYDPKTVTITVQPKTTVTLAALPPPIAANITPELTLAEDGKSYTLEVQPKDIKHPIQVPLRINVTLGKVAQAPLTIFISIK